MLLRLGLDMLEGLAMVYVGACLRYVQAELPG